MGDRIKIGEYYGKVVSYGLRDRIDAIVKSELLLGMGLCIAEEEKWSLSNHEASTINN